MCFKISKILAIDKDNFAYNFANVGMKPEHKGRNIFVYLYNKESLKIWWTRCGNRKFGVGYLEVTLL